MPDRSAVEFLRRRYAAAILSDDADTACRLRGQLDRIMNFAGRPDRTPQPQVERSPEVTAQALADARAPAAGRFPPTVHVATLVTGLLEAPRFLPRAVRSVAAPTSSSGSGAI